jgi:hypothetical protein
MTAVAILKSLNSFPNTQGHSYTAAQAGFLEWVFALPISICPRTAAQQALVGMTNHPVISDAGTYFYDFVKQAAQAEPLPPRRRGRRLRRKATVH